MWFITVCVIFYQGHIDWVIVVVRTASCCPWHIVQTRCYYCQPFPLGWLVKLFHMPSCFLCCLCWLVVGYFSIVPRLSPRPDAKYKRRGRTWYQFTRDIAARWRHSYNYKRCDTSSYTIGWLEQLRYYYWKVSRDCASETSARLKQQQQWRSTQHVGKTVPIYCCYALLRKEIAARLWRKALLG